MSRVHELKSYPYLFEATLRGTKKHDMRRADRGFRVGDRVLLREYDDKLERFTGRSLLATIGYITSVENPCALSHDGLREGYCILSLRMSPFQSMRNLYLARRSAKSGAIASS